MKKNLLKTLSLSILAIGGGGNLQAQAQSVSFTKATDEQADVYGIKAQYGFPIIADFNNDGKLDIYVSGEKSSPSWGDACFLSYNNGDGTYNTVEPNGIAKFRYGNGSKAFDMNQDGYMDFFFFGANQDGWGGLTQHFGICKNNGDGTFTTTKIDEISFDFDGRSQVNEGNALHSASIADYNKDGYPDILLQYLGWINGSYERVVVILKNNNGENFEIVRPSCFLPMSHGSVSFGDFDGDGWPDIVSVGYGNDVTVDETEVKGGGQMAFYRNTHDGNFELAKEVYGNDLNAGLHKWGFDDDAVLYVLDYDQDGKMDVLCIGGVGEAEEKRALLLHNVSNENGFAFEEQETNIYPHSGSSTRLSILADLNGDGWVDNFVYGWNNGWALRCASSKGSYNQFDIINSGYDLNSWQENNTTFGDLDGDGLIDIMCANSTDRLSVTYNTTSATPVKPTAPTGVSASYDESAQQLTVKWDCADLTTGSRPFYNLYLKNHTTGKTYMLVPANVESGAQSTYSDFSSYVLNKEYTFENVEDGEYTVGVQAVTYSWQASEFTTLHFATSLNLDENAESTDLKEIEYLDVNMNRTFKGNDTWNTFCVPFDMGTEEFTAVKKLTGASTSGETTTLTFEDATEIEAGVPYIVKVAEAKESLTVNGVTVKAAAPEKTAVTVSDGSNTITMVGNYAKTTISNGEFFISNNAFYVADQDVTVKGYRAYITIEGATAGVNRMLIDIDGDATAIEEVLAGEDKLVDVYTISGIRVKNGVKAGEALDGLAKGIYIVNGKKVIK